MGQSAHEREREWARLHMRERKWESAYERERERKRTGVHIGERDTECK